MKNKTAEEYRKKPVVIQAIQWNKNGDHPQDGEAIEKPFSVEGKIVRYFRRPDVDGQSECKHCGQRMHFHGWIDTLEGGHIVCPGDWIITGVNGENYPCKNDIFLKTYEPASSPSAVEKVAEVSDEAFENILFDFLQGINGMNETKESIRSLFASK